MTQTSNLDKGVAGLLLLADGCRRAPWTEVARAALAGLAYGLGSAVVVTFA